MKGMSVGIQGKRRPRCLATGVLFLVLLSMLVPLVLLLGLYSGFHPPALAYPTDQPSSTFTPGVVNVAENKTISRGITVPRLIVPQPLPKINNASAIDAVRISEEESGKSCEERFGSYCLWREMHREPMKDSMVKKLKDLLFLARAYYPTIAKIPAQSKLSQELRQNIQDLERVLSESTTDAELAQQTEKKSQRMEAAIARAKTFPVDCNNVDKKLRQIFDLTEDEANFHMKQSAFLFQLAVQTMPKSLHCLSMRLTVECFRSSLHNQDLSLSEKYSDPTLHHYVIFSKNALSSSVVINSTVTHARESGHMVFHVLTDGQNYFAMKLWFFKNTYREAAVRVFNVEHLNMEYLDKAELTSISLPVELRVSFRSTDNPSSTYMTTEYVSVFSHSHYLLPYIFKDLKRVVVLDDDVVVQRDLSDLWNLNMGGKVNGALQLCSVRLEHLQSYLGEKGYDKDSCAWMSGLNVIDLVRWRELDLTETYRALRQQVSRGTGSIEGAALSLSLLAFHDLIYPLDDVWVLSGLGHDFGLNVQAIKNAAVLHYNGQMKPWLELGIPKYKHYWKRYLNREDLFMGECNVNP